MKRPVWVAESADLAMHERLIDAYGGASGIRDRGLLESALARPQQLAAYGQSPDLVDLAAAYASGVVRNHPFLDGNQRTGFLTAYVFLARNGLQVIASEAEATQAVIELAAGTLDEAGFASWLRANVAKQRRR
jgi:death-on-curing protein